MKEDIPFVSVVICTRNRARQLRRMLDSMCAVEIPEGLGWEVVVVDNGSVDDTPRAVLEFADRLPIRRVWEPEPGIANARNRGVEAARGAYICWTDDDVLVDRHWLAAYCEAFARHPGAAVFGGKILPQLEAPAAPWFARQLDRWPLNCLTASRDFGEEVVPLDLACGRIPCGANFAVRAREQKQARYDPALTRLGEESQVIHHILARGGEGWWVPASAVSHLIPAERQTRSYVVQYCRDVGGAAAYLERAFPRDNANWASGARRWLDTSAPELRILAWASLMVSCVAGIVRLESLSLRFLARHGHFEGRLHNMVAAHRGANAGLQLPAAKEA